jgi:hypothetical protein
MCTISSLIYQKRNLYQEKKLSKTSIFKQDTIFILIKEEYINFLMSKSTESDSV